MFNIDSTQEMESTKISLLYIILNLFSVFILIFNLGMYWGNNSLSAHGG